MKKRFLILFIAVVVCIVATSLTKKRVESKPIMAMEQDASLNLPFIAPITNWQALFQDNWEFSVPGNEWSVEDISDPDTKVVVRNLNSESVIVLIKEQTANTYPGYIISTIQSFSDRDAEILSMEQVTVNGTKSIKVHMVNKDKEAVWSWITFKDGFGYTFSCGGEVSLAGRNARSDYCQSIADTLHIK